MGSVHLPGAAMSAPQIGVWVKRTGTKWHLVDSVVAGDAVTRCGRRMRDPDLQVSEVMPLTRMIGQPQLCKAGCDPGGMVVFNKEDDPNVAHEPVVA